MSIIIDLPGELNARLVAQVIDRTGLDDNTAEDVVTIVAAELARGIAEGELEVGSRG